MKVAHLSDQVLKKIRRLRYDRIIEKHEGPFDWKDELKYGSPEFMNIEGHAVLLPVDRKQHRNITTLRCIVSERQQSLTIFLKDTTFIDDPECAFFQAGFVAICDRVPREDFFVTVLYHEWFVVENKTLAALRVREKKPKRT